MKEHKHFRPVTKSDYPYIATRFYHSTHAWGGIIKDGKKLALCGRLISSCQLAEIQAKTINCQDCVRYLFNHGIIR